MTVHVKRTKEFFEFCIEAHVYDNLSINNSFEIL